MATWKELPDMKPLFGRRVTDLGQEWELVAQNDLHVPYFVKVVRGKAQKTQYAGETLTLLAQRELLAYVSHSYDPRWGGMKECKCIGEHPYSS